MAYKQDAGRDDLTNPNISALTKPSDFNKALYESSKNVQDIISRGLSTNQPSEVLSNPELTTFRPRGSEAYKASAFSTDKNLTEFTQGVPASFSKGKGRTPYLSSRFNVNPQRKSNMANTMEENQLLDVRTARLGRPQTAVKQFNRVNTNQVSYRNDVKAPRADLFYDDIISGQTTSYENRVAPNKPLSTTWIPGTTQKANAATYDQKPGNLGYNLDGRTLAQKDKAKDDALAKTMIDLHPDQVRPAEKAAKRSSKVAKTLEEAFLTGSESMMNKAITAANQTLKTDKYFSRSGNEAYHNKPDLPMKNQVTYQHEEMIKNYDKKSGTATSQQNSSDKLKFITQDFAKDKASGKFSLNSNNSSNSNITANNLFKSPALTTDITDGKKKRFNF